MHQRSLELPIESTVTLRRCPDPDVGELFPDLVRPLNSELAFQTGHSILLLKGCFAIHSIPSLIPIYPTNTLISYLLSLWPTPCTTNLLQMYHEQAPYQPQVNPNMHGGEHDGLHHHHHHHHGNNVNPAAGQAYHTNGAHSLGHSSQQQQNHAGAEEVNDNVGDDAGAGDDAPAKKKRKKVSHACLYCRRSHMVCDEGRPCQRWYVLVLVILLPLVTN